MPKPDTNAEEARLRALVDDLIADMIAANVVEKIVATDDRVDKDYWILATPNAFEKPFVAIAVLGCPEQAGVWSYTLLSQSRADETSMEPYFRQFADRDFGLIAINPNCFGSDLQGETFAYQLDRVVSQIPPTAKCGLIGFSMGGGVVLNYLDQHPDILPRMAGLVLLDPTLPNRIRLNNIRPLLDSNTLLIASQGIGNSPGKLASAMLSIPAVSIPGIHGEMPTKALNKVLDFYRERII